MVFRRCERPDPYAKRVLEMYHANVVLAPRVGLGPMTVVAQLDRHVEMRGVLLPILVPDEGPLELPEVDGQPVAALSGQRSAELDLEVGISLLGKFLAALAGVPLPNVSVEGTVWKHASKISFETRSVVEQSVDVNLLGSALRGRRVDREHPSASMFFDGSGTKMRLISRALTSADVAVRASKENGENITVEAGAIADLLGNASATVGWKVEEEGSVVFTGQAPATFAIAHVPCTLKPDGRIALGLALGGGKYLDTPGGTESAIDLDHYPLVNEDGLLEFDEV